MKSQTLKIEFKKLKMKEDERIQDHCMRAKACVEKKKTFADKVKNQFIMKKVLRILFPKWNHVAIIIEKRKDPITLTFYHIIGSLISYKEIFSSTPTI